MEIPLVLIGPRNGRLVYRVPAWYRAVIAAIAAIVVTAFAMDGNSPSLFGWFILAVLALTGLYEERWTFDLEAGRVSHREGLLVAAKTKNLEMANIARFRIAPYVRGTIPGSEDERLENEAALAGGRSDDLGRKRAIYKKAYLRLIVEDAEGKPWLVDTVAARDLHTLRAKAERIAAHCGKPLIEG